MAFTREFIRSLAKECDIELPKEFINGIIDEHTTARNAYADDQVKAELAKNPTVQVENVKDTEEYKALKKSFDDYKDEIAKKEAKATKEKAYRDILKDANLNEKGIEKAVKYAEWDKMELETDGKIKGSKDLIKAAKEEWAEYVTTTTITGADTSTPPTNNGGNTTLTKADIYKKDDKGRYIMSTSERQKALAENPDIMR